MEDMVPLQLRSVFHMVQMLYEEGVNGLCKSGETLYRRAEKVSVRFLSEFPGISLVLAKQIYNHRCKVEIVFWNTGSGG